MDEKGVIKVSLGTAICMLTIMLLIIALIGMYYYYNYVAIEKNVSTSTVGQDNSETNVITKADIKESDIKEWALAQLKAYNDANKEEKLLDYRVDGVKILHDDQKKELLSFGYKMTDVLAYVTYSVKPENVNTSNWLSGNGEVSGSWINGKSICVCFKDGKIPEVEKGVEFYGLGATGW